MPLLYGEGTKAFIRLQEEIIKETNDQSIFAWELGMKSLEGEITGVLAPSPSKFLNSRNIEAHTASGEPPRVTSKGVRIELPIVEKMREGYVLREFDHLGARPYVGVLACHFSNEPEHSIGIWLKTDPEDNEKLHRIFPDFERIRNRSAHEKARRPVFLLKRNRYVDLGQGITDCWIRIPRTFQLVAAIPQVAWDLQSGHMAIRQWWSPTKTAVAFSSTNE